MVGGTAPLVRPLLGRCSGTGCVRGLGAGCDDGRVEGREGADGVALGRDGDDGVLLGRLGAGREGACGAGREGACGAGRDGACGAGRDGACGAGRDGACGAGREGAEPRPLPEFPGRCCAQAVWGASANRAAISVDAYRASRDFIASSD